eukprot:gene25914-gene1029
MPRLLIKDAHEWTNEIPSVPTYYLAKQQSRERSRDEAGGDRKNTTGITGLWQPSVHSDVAF